MKKHALFYLAAGAAFFLQTNVCAARIVRPLIVAPQDSQEARDIRTGLEKAFLDMNVDADIRFVPETCGTASSFSVPPAVLRRTDFVIGHFCSSSFEKAGAEYRKNNIPVFVLGITDPTLTAAPNKHIVRLIPRTNSLYAGFIRELKKRHPSGRYIIADDATDKSDAFVEILKKELPRSHIKIIELPEKQADDNIKKLSELSDFKADFVIVTSSLTRHAVRVISRIREAGLKMPVVGLNTLGTLEFSQMLGSMKDNIFFYRPEHGHHLLDAVPLVAEMRFNGDEVGELTVVSYAAVQVYHQADARRTGDARVVFHETKFQTFLGDVDFDAFGDVKNLFPGQFFRWEENAVVPARQLVEIK